MGRASRLRSFRFVRIRLGARRPGIMDTSRGAVWPAPGRRSPHLLPRSEPHEADPARPRPTVAPLDFRRSVAETVRMGVSAAVAGFRGGFNRGIVVGETDEYLVARARAGDDAAFEAIYDRYARGVLAFCVHMLGNREAGEDALQLTFVSAFRTLRRSDSDISLRPWLYTIARNRCLSELRTRRELDVDAMASDRPSREGVADQVQRREDLREMLDDMRRLPPDQRAALVLFELGDHSHEEIAAVLGVRKEKVKALVFQAREALLRGRRAREHPCADIRERLATTRGRVLPRSVARAHIDRCPGCAAFEREVRRQRAALALILPVVATSGLKASVLGSALHGGGPWAAVGATAAGGVGGAGTVAAGGTAAAGGVTGAGAVTAGTTTAAGMTAASAVAAGSGAAGSVSVSAAAAGTAVIAGAPSLAAVAGGVVGVGTEYAATVGSVGGLGAAGILGKVLTAAVIATAGAGAIHAGHGTPAPPAPPAALAAQMPSSTAATPPITASAPANAMSPATAGSVSPAVATTPIAAPQSTTGSATTTILVAPNTTAGTSPAPAGSSSTPASATTPAPASTPDADSPSTTTAPAATPSTSAAATTTASAAPPDSSTITTTTTPAAAPSTTDATAGTATDAAPASTTTSPAAAPSTTDVTDATTPPAPSPSTDSTGTTAAAAPSTTTPTTSASDITAVTGGTVTATSDAPATSTDAITGSAAVSSST